MRSSRREKLFHLHRNVPYVRRIKKAQTSTSAASQKPSDQLTEASFSVDASIEYRSTNLCTPYLRGKATKQNDNDSDEKTDNMNNMQPDVPTNIDFDTISDETDSAEANTDKSTTDEIFRNADCASSDTFPIGSANEPRVSTNDRLLDNAPCLRDTISEQYKEEPGNKNNIQPNVSANKDFDRISNENDSEAVNSAQSAADSTCRTTDYVNKTHSNGASSIGSPNDHDVHETDPAQENADMEDKIHPNLNVSRVEVMFMLMNIFMRHNLTNIAITDILCMINLIVGFDSLPENYNEFQDFFGTHQYTRHYVCKHCGYYIGTKDARCSNCNECKTFFFIMFDFCSNLRDILRHNWTEIVKYQQEIINNSTVTDITNAAVVTSNYVKNQITLCINTDGVKIFNSNIKRSLWPIIAIINELPPRLRFLRKNVIVAGLWLFNGDPDVDVFMKPFLQVLRKLHLEGLDIGSTIIPSIRTVACCVDTKARCKIQNFKQFNGYEGCSFCLHPGHQASGSQIKYGFIKNVQLRNHLDTLKAMALSDSREIPVNGVKGISPLILIPSFDVIKNCPVDYMHAILLGVTKQLTKIWFEKPKTPYYIKSEIKIIDKCLESIGSFTEASRSARKITDRNSWKANEWLHWVLHYSSCILKCVLPSEYYNHYRLLVTSVSDLLQPNITADVLDLCNNRLTNFVEQFEKLYSIDEMNYNVHLLMHVVECCRNYGPLWTVSLFVFEDINGLLKSYVKGPKEPLIQIANRCSLSHVRHHSDKLSKLSSNVHDFCKGMSMKTKNSPHLLNFEYKLPENVINDYDSNRFYELSYLKYRNYTYKRSSTGANNLPNNNSYFAYSSETGLGLGEIRKILTDNESYYFLFRSIKHVEIESDFLEELSIDEALNLIKVDETVSKYIRIDCNKSIYYCKLKYTFYVD